MPRRNSGPRLRFLAKRSCYYIVWTESGRSRERSTGTADCAVAEIALAEFLRRRTRASGPRDPSEVLVTDDVLADYAEERGPETAAPWRIACAVEGLADHWEGRSIAEVSRQTCAAYVKRRGRSAGTTRRELGVLRAAINHAHREGRITRPVAVHLPDRPEPRDRWLTRNEAAELLKASLHEPRARLHLPLFILVGLYTANGRKQFSPYVGRRSISTRAVSILTRQDEGRPINAAPTRLFHVASFHTSDGPEFVELIWASLSIGMAAASET
jgi:hypothetical protein